MGNQSPEFWVINCYFNFFNSPEREESFRLSSGHLLAQGASLLSVELAYKDAPFVQQGEQEFLRIRTNSLLWHKERLINLGLNALPAACRYVAWIDGDLILERDDWLGAATIELERVDLLQLFDEIVPLTRGLTEPTSIETEGHSSYAALYAKYGAEMFSPGVHSGAYPNPGSALAARRSLFPSGLYDKMILGGGDDILLRACTNMLDQIDILTPQARSDVLRWRASFINDNTLPRLGCLSGRIRHLWHGDPAERRYHKRHAILQQAQFDPDADLELEESGLYRLGRHRSELAQQIQRYFSTREVHGNMNSANLG